MSIQPWDLAQPPAIYGGAAESPAVQKILTQMVDIPVVVPEFDEYVTKGAAMQAAAALTGSFPSWPTVKAELPPEALEAQIAEQHNAAKAVLGYDAAKQDQPPRGPLTQPTNKGMASYPRSTDTSVPA